MKKAIAILLVLLVAGTVFGVGNATLTLGSTVAGVMRHGFLKTTIDTPNFGTINAGLGADVKDASYSAATEDAINLLASVTTTPVPVGYYYFVANTSTTGYSVKFTVNPFSNGSFTVPYILNYSQLVASDDVTITAGSIPTVGSLGSTIEPSDPTEVISSLNPSPNARYAGLALTLTIDGAANTAYGLSAGTYVGSVVANITAN